MNDMVPLPGGATPVTFNGEIAATSAATYARSMVEARYGIAMRNRRNWDQVRQDLLKECRRPKFANNKSAYYRKPIGKGVEGLGIRFVEVAIRCMTNILIETTLVYEDDQKEVYRVAVTDLEANITYPGDVKISKTVERSKPNDDGSYIAVRRNSYGSLVYTVAATDDDLLNKRNALISKMVRTLGLRLIPGDLQDEGEEIIKAIRMDEAARDPEAERKRIADAFASIGVKASQLSDFLGHEIGTCSPTELVELRGYFGAIKDGEATWAGVMATKGADAEPGEEGDGEKKAPPVNAAAEKIKERLRSKKEGKAPPPAAEAPTAAPKAPDGAAAAPPASAVPPGDALFIDEQQAGPSAEVLRDQLMKAPDVEAAEVVIDLARHLPKADYDSLVELLDQRFPKD